MRDSFSNALVNAAKNDSRVYLLTGDHGYALFDDLRKNCPEKYINAGIAEQNMVGVAAGMAKSGLIPIVYGLAAFIPIRVLEQIKLDICFENLQVILIGDGAGVVYSKLGVSHQCFEDISAVKALPNIRIMSPSDQYEMKLCMEAAIHYKGPTYLRIGKSDQGTVHSSSDILKTPGIHQVIKSDKNQPIIFATGSMVNVAKKMIEGELKGFGLCSVSMIKPFNADSFDNYSLHADMIISIEEHSIYGGLGSSISEHVSLTKPKKVLRLGIEDKFSDKCGTYEYLMVEHKLDEKSLIQKIKSYI